MRAIPMTKGVCVVTGGAGPGIGSAICEAVSRAGYLTVVADVDEKGAASVAAELVAAGATAASLELDVSSAVSVSEGFRDVASTHGPIAALVNSAGIGGNLGLLEADEAQYERVLAVNLKGAWLCSRAALESMLEAGRGGSIVNIGSVHAARNTPGHGMYAATKAGLVGLTRGVACEYGYACVRCNIVHPGAVDSSQTREILISLGHDPDAWLADFVRRRQMLPLPVTASHVANAVAFLLDERAAAITGAELFVDGGLNAMLWDADDAGVEPVRASRS